MKSLSVKPIYAAQIVSGEKPIEYRTWQTPYRGDLLICSSQNPKTKGCISGHALGVISLDNITYNAKEKLYEWHVSNPRLVKPFPVKGKLHLYDISDDLIIYVDDMEESVDDIVNHYFIPLMN